ncbi:MAG TPA: saccharopine dehydrogenase NADP-binding domain-containing protein, partial [Levilinea sp.]|nr:saccharopine dehydrogenase NADP-binding domain-containing protein [Levilinea sp.]
MNKILILGGTGYTGKRIARYLLEQSDACIALAARNLDKVQVFTEELNQQFPGNRVLARYADASNTDSLRLAFADQNMVVVAAPTTAYAKNVIRSSIDMGLDYLDVQLGAHKFVILQSLAVEIERAGLCYITEAGYHPGLPSALVRYAATQLDLLQSAITAGFLNMGKGLPYSEAMDELVESFKSY